MDLQTNWIHTLKDIVSFTIPSLLQQGTPLPPEVDTSAPRKSPSQRPAGTGTGMPQVCAAARARVPACLPLAWFAKYAFLFYPFGEKESAKTLGGTIFRKEGDKACVLPPTPTLFFCKE